MEDIHNVLKFLLHHKADIICLQELSINYPHQPVKNTAEQVAIELGYNAYYKKIPLAHKDGRKWSLANGIFSRFTISHPYYLWLNQPQNPDFYTNQARAYIQANIHIKRKVLTLGTTHLSYSKNFINTPQRQHEADLLLRVIKRRKKHFIFTGDLNSRPNSYTISNLRHYLKHAGPPTNQNTFTTKPHLYPDLAGHGLDWRIDYVFSTPDLKVASSRILRTKYSDHLPIMASFKLP